MGAAWRCRRLFHHHPDLDGDNIGRHPLEHNYCDSLFCSSRNTANARIASDFGESKCRGV